MSGIGIPFRFFCLILLSSYIFIADSLANNSIHNKSFDSIDSHIRKTAEYTENEDNIDYKTGRTENKIRQEKDLNSNPDQPEPLYQVRALVSPKDSVVITAQIEGEVIETPFLEGDRFKKNDILIKFNCQIYDLEKKRALANYNTQVSARQNVEKLISSKSASKLELTFAQSNEEISKVEHEMSKIAVANCLVRAPFNGKVSQIGVNRFEFVAKGTQIIEIINDEELQIKIIIPSLALRWLKTDYEFDVLLDETGKRHKAKVVKIASSIDPVSQTVAVTAKFIDLHPDIIPGMSGLATFYKR